MLLHKFHTQYYFLSDSDTLFCEYIVVPEVLLFWLTESNKVIGRQKRRYVNLYPTFTDSSGCKFSFLFCFPSYV